MAVGTDRPFVAAILNIDMENVGQWAENHQIAYTTYTDLTQKPQVLELIRREVERVNRELPPSAQVLRFVLLYKELDADDEELTRTRKIRRQFVAKKYADVIEGLYSDQDIIDVKGTIRYQDWREVVIETQMAVVDVRRKEEDVA